MVNYRIKRIISIFLIAGILSTGQCIPALAMSKGLALQDTPACAPSDLDASYSELDETEKSDEVSVVKEEGLENDAYANDAAADDGLADEDITEAAPADGVILDDTVEEQLIADDASSDEAPDDTGDEATESEMTLPVIDEAEKAAAQEERAMSPLKLGFVPGEIIIEYEDVYAQDEIEALVNSLDGSLETIMMEADGHTFALVKISDDTRVATAVAIYGAQLQIASAGKNVVARLSSYDKDGTNDPRIKDQYSLKNPDTVAGGAAILKAWDRLKAYEDNGNTLTSVGVTVIDTGCLLTHEDLDGVINTEKSFEILDDLTAQPLQGDNYNNGEEPKKAMLSHGTHVAGIIGAQADNGVGIAGAASILGDKLDLSVVDAASADSSGESFELANLISAIGIAVDNGSRVINLSLGAVVHESYLSECVEFEKALDVAYKAGVVIVCAAGNEGSSATAIPSDYSTTISVINTDANAKRVKSSNYGLKKDLCAPGTGIVSTYGNEDEPYKVLDGTSMSSPLVAAVAAMMLSVDPELTPDEVRRVLKNTATDLGSTGFDAQYAAGLLNADKAIKAVIEEDYGPEEMIINDEDDTSGSNNNNSSNTDNPGWGNWTGGNGGGSGGSGGGSGGGGGGGGGGSFDSGKAAPTVISGSFTANPLTKKQKFVSSTGTVYRNAWIEVEVKDTAGSPVKHKIYVDANGDVVTGWQWIRCSDGQIRRFYFSEALDGTYGTYYQSRVTPDGNMADGNGYWTVNGVVQLAGQETITRIPAAEAGEVAAAAAERAKSPAELGYMPGQLMLKTTGTRQQIDVNVALMGGTVAGINTLADGTSLVVVNIAPHTTVATAQTLYKANPVFTSVTKNVSLGLQ